MNSDQMERVLSEAKRETDSARKGEMIGKLLMAASIPPATVKDYPDAVHKLEVAARLLRCVEKGILRGLRVSTGRVQGDVASIGKDGMVRIKGLRGSAFHPIGVDLV